MPTEKIQHSGISKRLRQERFIASEYEKLMRREPAKYIKYAIRDYVLWITRLAPALRPAYLSCRIIDDIADGERECPSEFDGSFPVLIEQAQEQIRTGQKRTQSDILELLDTAIASTERREIHQGEVREAFAGLLDAMLIEFHRRVEKRLLNQDKLVQIHTDSSFHAHNIGLVCLGSNNRASDTPELSELIGRMDALRDMPKDLRLGIVNVPSEAMTDGCTYDGLVEQPQSVYQYPEIVSWMRSELCAGEELIQSLETYDVDRMATMILKSRMQRRVPFVREKYPAFLDKVTGATMDTNS